MKIITNKEIEILASYVAQKVELAKQLRALEVAIESAETELKEAIQSGTPIVSLEYTVAINETSRRSPSWKSEFEKLAGKAAAQQVLENTAPSVTQHIVITKTEAIKVA